MKKSLISFFLCVLLIFSSYNTAQSQEQNFELKLIFSSDNILYDSIAQVFKQQMTPLFIDINLAGSPQPVFFSELTDFDFDLAIISLDTVTNNFPPLHDQFSPDSYTGNTIYRLNDDFVLSSINLSSPQTFFDNINSYHTSNNIKDKINNAIEIQREYNDHISLDIPLISSSTIAVNWNDFENFDISEGLIKSLFLGSTWSNNPNERISQSRSINEIHYALYNFQQLNNPIYYQGRDGFLSLEPFYSSAFLIDKFNRLQPNIVYSYEDIKNQDGTNTFILNIRDDINWSDNEKLDASDLKFTYDLVSSDWIGATNYNDWKNVKSINIINDFQIEIIFYDQSIENPYNIANQFIIPEHILNSTFIVNDLQYHPYDGYSPFKSELWQNYTSNPITSGPYNYDLENSKNNIVEIGILNQDYWTPSILDYENHIFNLTSNINHEPYYFIDQTSLSIQNLVYHVSGSKNIDQNSLINSLQSGSRDIIELPYLSTTDIFDQNDFKITSSGKSGGGIVILYNVYNSHLYNFEIRKAISKAINRNDISKIMGLGYSPQLNPISTHYDLFYDQNTSIDYDYQYARDTFRRLGYSASESILTNSEYSWPWQNLNYKNDIMIITFLIITIHYGNYRKRRLFL